MSSSHQQVLRAPIVLQRNLAVIENDPGPFCPSLLPPPPAALNYTRHTQTQKGGGEFLSVCEEYLLDLTPASPEFPWFWFSPKSQFHIFSLSNSASRHAPPAVHFFERSSSNEREAPDPELPATRTASRAKLRCCTFSACLWLTVVLLYCPLPAGVPVLSIWIWICFLGYTDRKRKRSFSGLNPAHLFRPISQFRYRSYLNAVPQFHTSSGEGYKLGNAFTLHLTLMHIDASPKGTRLGLES